MQRLRIAFVVDRFGQRWGGAEAYGVALVRELAQYHDITIFARDYDPDCGISLPYVMLKTRAFWPSWYRVWRHARQVARQTRVGYDIVHSHNNGWAGDVEVVHVTPVRYRWKVRPLHGFKRWMACVSPRVQTYLWLEKRRVAQGENRHIVAVSALIQQQLQQAYGRPVATAVIPPGVNLGPLNADQGTREMARHRLGLAAQDHVGILVARNPLRKGLESAMQAYSKLPSMYKLMVVGCGPETLLAAQSLASNAGLDKRMIWIAPTADVSTYYQMADCCVHPTRNDSFGMVPLEAMAHSLPVVLSPSPWCGFADYLTHEQDAILLEHPDDIEGLAQSIQRLATDSDYRRHIVQRGLKQAQAHAWPTIAAQYLALYADIQHVRSSRATSKSDKLHTP